MSPEIGPNYARQKCIEGNDTHAWREADHTTCNKAAGVELPLGHLVEWKGQTGMMKGQGHKM